MTGAAGRPSGKRRLILHLGLPKTGTTTIQAFLRANTESLDRAGFIYPSPGAELGDHPLLRPTAFQPRLDKEINHRALAGEIRAPPGRGAAPPAQTPLWRAAFDQIDRGGAHTAIVSFENFARQPRVYRFDVLAPRLGAFDVRGMVYLRRPEDWAVSLFGQGIRGTDRATRSFAQFAKRLERHLAYSEMLDAVRRHFPLDALEVVDFHAACAKGLVEDFADRAGLPREAVCAAGDIDTRNGSPPDWAVLFLLWCNRARLSDDAFLETRKRLIVLAKRGWLPELRPGLDLASPDERARLREVAARDAPRLLEDYGVAFEPKPPEPRAWRPFDRVDFDEIRAAITPRLAPSARRALAAIHPPEPRDDEAPARDRTPSAGN